MGYIYKITNLINNKIYIGQTKMTIMGRMYKHCERARNNPKATGIDAAIRKYGKDNFLVEEICQCSNEQLDDLEIFYIKKYNTFLGEGYNLTAGGQGASSLNLNELEVIQKYLLFGTVKQTAQYFNCCEKTISNILHNNNIEIKHNNNSQNVIGRGRKFEIGEKAKPVKLVELNLLFPSLAECSQWLIDKGYSKANSMEMARKSLSRVLNGERKTYCKFHFEFV